MRGADIGFDLYSSGEAQAPEPEELTSSEPPLRVGKEKTYFQGNMMAKGAAVAVGDIQSLETKYWTLGADKATKSATVSLHLE